MMREILVVPIVILSIALIMTKSQIMRLNIMRLQCYNEIMKY